MKTHATIAAIGASVGLLIGAVVGLAIWELAFGAFRRAGR